MATNKKKPSTGHTSKNEPVLNHLKIEQIKISELAYFSRRVRKHPKKQLAKLERSIGKFGQIAPVIIDDKHRIIDGEAIVSVMKELGFEEINAIQLENLDDSELRSLRLVLNRITQDAEWDAEQLALELQDLFELDVDLEITSFDTPEIDASFTLLEDTTPDDIVDNLPITTKIPKRTSSGQVWQCGDHVLICGDATETSIYTYFATFGIPKMLFTDPPYNVKINGHVCGKGAIQHAEFAMASGEMTEDEFTQFLYDFLQAQNIIMPDGSLLYICMDWRHMQELQTAAENCELSLINLCIWNKSNAGMGSLYRSKHELVFVFKKGIISHQNNIELGKHGRNRTNVWDYPSVNSNDPTRVGDLAFHPTVKPVQLVADAILDVTRRGDWIIDPFGGSGTTMLAAEQTGRRAMLVELSEHYCDVILARFEAVTGITPYLTNTLDMKSGDSLPFLPGADCNADKILDQEEY